MTPLDGGISLALHELRQGRPDRALSRLAMMPAHDAEWHRVRGMALLADNEWSAARDALIAAMAAGDGSPETALNLALAEAGSGGEDAAIARMGALEFAHPLWSEPPFRLAELYRGAARSTQARAAYERALALSPARTDIAIRLATLCLTTGDASRSESLLLECCGRNPRNWEAWDALGITECSLGFTDAAETAFFRAHLLNPASLAIALRLVSCAVARGTAEAELARQDLASQANPLDTVILAARATLHLELGREAACCELIGAAVTIARSIADDRCAGSPLPELLALRADLLTRTTRYAEATEALQDALAFEPGHAARRNNLSVGLTRTHRYREALAVLDALQADEGERVDALCNRANALVCLGRQAEGEAAARRATELADAQDFCRHLAWRTLANALCYGERASASLLNPVLAQVGRTAPRTLPPLPARPRSASPAHEPGRRLRVGLLSATLKSHPVGWLTLAGWENLDPAQFDLVCIAQPEGSDPMQRRFRAVASAWHPWAERGLPGLAERVRALDLDIIVDLGGYGDQGLLGACAERLAPVQIKWVGMQNHGTCLPEMDWFVSDRWETPPELARHYTERLLLLPDGYVCYAPPAHAPAVGPLPGLALGHVTFGCFNNLAKVTPLVVMTWANILRALPDAKLVLKNHQLGDGPTARSIHDAFEALGVSPGRVELRGGSGHRRLLAEYGDVDLVLDPFPYSGGLTTCEALWMGVPVLTFPGETFASRHSTSHVSNVGLAEWVVPDRDAYVTEAVRRARDLPALAALRAGLRGRMRASPLCDAARFGRNLGAALRRAWLQTPALPDDSSHTWGAPAPPQGSAPT